MERAIEKQLQNTLKVFAPISLQQLNASVSFLERIDTKYLVHVKQLSEIVKELERDYYVLNIKDIRLFAYDNVYMDSKDLSFYYAHERGDNVRVKVRTRYYVDSDLCYFEYKHKEGKVIRKFRYQEAPALHGLMDDEAAHFFNSIYGSLMEGSSKITIAPMLKTTYRRFTLCSKSNDERITIDLDLAFEDPNNPHGPKIELPHLAIIESKAGSEMSRSAKVLKKYGIKKASGCSKYCLGLCYLGKVTSQEKFKKTLKDIEALGGPVSIKRVQKKIKHVVKKSSRSVQALQNSIIAAKRGVATKKAVAAKKKVAKKTPTKKVATKPVRKPVKRVAKRK